MEEVKFVRCIQSAYNALQAKNADAIYFCTDTGNMYLGDAVLFESNAYVDASISGKTITFTTHGADGTIDTDTLDLSSFATASEVADAIATALSSVYKPAGTIAKSGIVSGLLVANNVGNVYNVSEAFTIGSGSGDVSASLFVDAVAGNSYPSGTNIVVINNGTSQSPSYKFDVLAGFVDLSAYATTSYVDTLSANHVKINTGTGVYNNKETWDLHLTQAMSGKYVRITLPDSTLTKQVLLAIEISVIQRYSTGTSGKLFLFARHNTTDGDWSNPNCTLVGNFENTIEVYASDRKYIYIKGIYQYAIVSIDRVMNGYSAKNVDLTGITLDIVGSLPETYQTFTIKKMGSGMSITSSGVNLLDAYGSVIANIPIADIVSRLNYPEAFLTWGGKNFSSSFGPVDSALSNWIGTNKLAFIGADKVTVEYSRDAGVTWSDYASDNSYKTLLFTPNRSTTIRYYIGKSSSSSYATADCLLRVTVSTAGASIYTRLDKFMLYVATNGSSGCYVTIRVRTQKNVEDQVDTWVTVADAVGVTQYWNVINIDGFVTYGNSKSTQYGQIQFIFGCTSHSGSSSNIGFNVQKILGFGGMGWSTPSNLAELGHIYEWDYEQNAIFPNGVRPQTDNVSDLGTSSKRWMNIYGANGVFGAIALNGSDLATILGTKADDDSVVHKAGIETVTGRKDFTNGIRLESDTDKYVSLDPSNPPISKAGVYDAEVEYIGSTGTQFIDTGIVFNTYNDNITVDVDFTQDEIYAGSAVRSIWGFMGSPNSTPRWNVVTYQGKYMCSPNETTSTGVSNTIGRHVISTSMYYDGDTKVWSAKVDGVTTNTDVRLLNVATMDVNILPAFLFSRNNHGTAGNFMNSKIHRWTARVDGVTVADFIPVRVGQVGYMYDKVSGQLFGNDGTGDFVVGPDKTYEALTLSDNNSDEVLLKGVMTPEDDTDAANKKYVDDSVDGIDANVVHKVGTETISGDKTFTGGVVIDNEDSDYLSYIQLKGDDSSNGHSESIYLKRGEFSDGGMPLLKVDSQSGNEVVLRNISDPEEDTDAATKGYVDSSIGAIVIPDVSSKADKVSGATNGNLAGLNASGNLTDSGSKPSDFVHMTGNESIAGNKTFTGDMVLGGSLTSSELISTTDEITGAIITCIGGVSNHDISAQSITPSNGVGVVELRDDDASGSDKSVILKGIHTPENNGDAANKKYVDDSVGGIDNNVVHKTGDEMVGGVKRFTDEADFGGDAVLLGGSTGGYVHHNIRMTTDVPESGNGRMVLWDDEASGNDHTVYLGGIHVPSGSNDAVPKMYADNMELCERYTVYSGTAGMNGLHPDALCSLDANGQMTAYTNTGDVDDTQKTVDAQLRLLYDMPSMGIYRGGVEVLGRGTYTNVNFAPCGVFDIRTLSIVGEDLDSRWAEAGDDVYMSVELLVSKFNPCPAVVPTDNRVRPIRGFGPDIVISRTMINAAITEQNDCYDSSLTSGSNNYGIGYVYLGRVIRGYDVMLEASHPIYFLSNGRMFPFFTAVATEVKP